MRLHSLTVHLAPAFEFLFSFFYKIYLWEANLLGCITVLGHRTVACELWPGLRLHLTLFLAFDIAYWSVWPLPSDILKSVIHRDQPSVSTCIMPKSKTSPIERVNQHPNQSLCVKNFKLFCNVCAKALDHSKASHVKDHLNSKKHKEKIGKSVFKINVCCILNDSILHAKFMLPVF